MSSAAIQYIYVGCWRSVNTGARGIVLIRLRGGIVPRYQPGAAVESDVVPEPAQGHGQTVSDADQEKDVGRAPEEPAQKAPQAEPADAHHRGAAADHGEIALMAVPERGHRLAGEVCCDFSAYVATHLLGGWRYTWDGRASRAADSRQVSRSKDKRHARNRKILRDPDAAGLIRFNAKPLCGGGRYNAGRPNDGRGLYEAAGRLYAVFSAFRNRCRGFDVHADTFQRGFGVFG